MCVASNADRITCVCHHTHRSPQIDPVLCVIRAPLLNFTVLVHCIEVAAHAKTHVNVVNLKARRVSEPLSYIPTTFNPRVIPETICINIVHVYRLKLYCLSLYVRQLQYA